MEKVWQFLKKLNIELPYDRQSYFWIYIQKNWKQKLEQILALPHSQQYYAQ